MLDMKGNLNLIGKMLKKNVVLLHRYRKCPPCFLHAVTEDVGVRVLVFVKVAPNVIVFVVVVEANLTLVFVAVGNVIVWVIRPDRTVAGGSVDVVVVVTKIDSVVVIAGARIVVVVLTGISKVTVDTSASGARRSSCVARLVLAASMRARAHS